MSQLHSSGSLNAGHPEGRIRPNDGFDLAGGGGRDLAPTVADNRRQIDAELKYHTMNAITLAENPPLREAISSAAQEIMKSKKLPFPANPMVVCHGQSHLENPQAFHEGGSIRLSAFERDVGVVFGAWHDNGYRNNVAGDPYNFLEQRERYVDTYTMLAEVTEGLEPQEARTRAEELYAYLKENENNYLVARVLGHATKGIPFMVDQFRDRLTAQGVEEEAAAKQAQAMALLFAAHHSGFPITFVADGLLKGQVPQKFRRMLLIDDGALPTDDVPAKARSADMLRKKLIEKAAELGGISKLEAAKLVALTFTLDRITPGHEIEFWNKKGKLVVGNLLSDPSKQNVPTLFIEIAKQLRGEANTGYQTAKYLLTEAFADDPAFKNDPSIPALLEFIRMQAEGPEGIPGQRIQKQEALTGAGGLLADDAALLRGLHRAHPEIELPPYGGTFASVENDRKLVAALHEAEQRVSPRDEVIVANLFYLLRTLDMISQKLSEDLTVKEADVVKLFPDPQSPARLLHGAVNVCANGRRKVILDNMLKLALRKKQSEGIDILRYRDVTGGGAENPTYLVKQNETNATVYAVLNDSLEVARDDGVILDTMEAPNVACEISASVRNGKATASLRIRPDATAHIVTMDGSYFRELYADAGFTESVSSLMYQRLLNQP